MVDKLSKKLRENQNQPTHFPKSPGTREPSPVDDPTKPPKILLPAASDYTIIKSRHVRAHTVRGITPPPPPSNPPPKLNRAAVAQQFSSRKSRQLVTKLTSPIRDSLQNLKESISPSATTEKSGPEDRSSLSSRSSVRRSTYISNFLWTPDLDEEITPQRMNRTIQKKHESTPFGANVIVRQDSDLTNKNEAKTKKKISNAFKKFVRMFKKKNEHNS
ncbi:serine/threonine-protein kinase N3 [Acrasis kona]|uniref:Serine/threonine-protein kinase N3 n=1 Tax=Acrasis kona TaxID=1008807 RepID=A0AAW2ZQ47_9EUKA